MLCKCVENGQARVTGTNKITWFEKGMVADIIIDPKIGVPSHFVEVKSLEDEKDITNLQGIPLRKNDQKKTKIVIHNTKDDLDNV